MVEQTNAHDSATDDNDLGMTVYSDLQIQVDGPELIGCKRNLNTTITYHQVAVHLAAIVTKTSFPDKQLGIEAQKVRTVPGNCSWLCSHCDIAMPVSAPVQLPVITRVAFIPEEQCGRSRISRHYRLHFYQ